jgi:hypothetical protein
MREAPVSQQIIPWILSAIPPDFFGQKIHPHMILKPFDSRCSCVSKKIFDTLPNLSAIYIPGKQKIVRNFGFAQINSKNERFNCWIIA